MSYYRTCPSCGAHLDPDERCDCAAPPKSQPIGNLKSASADRFRQKDTAASSAKADGGKAEKVVRDQISTSSLDDTEGGCQA